MGASDLKTASVAVQEATPLTPNQQIAQMIESVVCGAGAAKGETFSEDVLNALIDMAIIYEEDIGTVWQVNGVKTELENEGFVVTVTTAISAEEGYTTKLMKVDWTNAPTLQEQLGI